MAIKHYVTSLDRSFPHPMNLHVRGKLWAGALALTVTGLAFAQTPDNAGRSANAGLAEPDQAFVLEAAANSNLEVQMSRVAVLRANANAVRSFAQNVAEDYSKARRKLKEIALSRDVRISDRLDDNRADILMTLQRYAGDEFDREYLTQQVDLHRRAVRLFQEQAQRGRHDELRSFAESKLAALEAQLRTAQALADSR
jgi:putative membrane protein